MNLLITPHYTIFLQGLRRDSHPLPVNIIKNCEINLGLIVTTFKIPTPHTPRWRYFPAISIAVFRQPLHQPFLLFLPIDFIILIWTRLFGDKVDLVFLRLFIRRWVSCFCSRQTRLTCLVFREDKLKPTFLTGLTQNINIENLSYFPSFLKSLCYKSVPKFCYNKLSKLLLEKEISWNSISEYWSSTLHWPVILPALSSLKPSFRPG